MAVVTALSLLYFKKHLDNTLIHRVWFLGGPVQSQDLDVILVGPFHLKIFCDSKTNPILYLGRLSR